MCRIGIDSFSDCLHCPCLAYTANRAVDMSRAGDIYLTTTQVTWPCWQSNILNAVWLTILITKSACCCSLSHTLLNRSREPKLIILDSGWYSSSPDTGISLSWTACILLCDKYGLHSTTYKLYDYSKHWLTETVLQMYETGCRLVMHQGRKKLCTKVWDGIYLKMSVPDILLFVW